MATKRKPKPVLAWARLDESGEILRDINDVPWLLVRRERYLPLVRVRIVPVAPKKRRSHGK